MFPARPRRPDHWSCGHGAAGEFDAAAPRRQPAAGRGRGHSRPFGRAEDLASPPLASRAALDGWDGGLTGCPQLRTVTAASRIRRFGVLCSPAYALVQGTARRETRPRPASRPFRKLDLFRVILLDALGYNDPNRQNS